MKKIILILSVLFLMTAGTTSRVITGRVVDSANKPIPGVSVVIKGTTTGTVTDANGAFTITVNEGSAALLFRCIGYSAEEVRIGASASILVMLTEDDSIAYEVVVSDLELLSTEAVAAPVFSKKARADNAAGLKVTGYATQNYPSVNCCPAPPAPPEFNTEGYTAIHENGFKSPFKSLFPLFRLM